MIPSMYNTFTVNLASVGDTPVASETLCSNSLICEVANHTDDAEFGSVRGRGQGKGTWAEI